MTAVGSGLGETIFREAVYAPQPATAGSRAAVDTTSTDTTSTDLEDLQMLLDCEAISQDEYDTKRSSILKRSVERGSVGRGAGGGGNDGGGVYNPGDPGGGYYQ